jgi:hypothetical protein
MTQLLTARAAARRMVLSALPARLVIRLGGEASELRARRSKLSRTLASELGPQGIRAV